MHCLSKCGFNLLTNCKGENPATAEPCTVTLGPEAAQQMVRLYYVRGVNTSGS